jgi:hypothetical protein
MIAQFLKNLTLIYNFELRTSALKNIKDVLQFVINNKAIKLNDEDTNDINVIVSFINNKLADNLKLQGHSELIQTFDQDTSNNNSNYVYVKSNRINSKK